MNTAQLIVLWYAGLIITGVLLVRASDTSSAGYLIGAISLVAALLLYTLKSHPQARKRRVLVAVVLPLIAIPASMASYAWYQGYAARRAQRSISHEQLEILGPALRRRGGGTHFVARVRNRSRHVLTDFTIRIEITENGETVEMVKQQCHLEVPPGEVRDLDQVLYGFKTSVINYRGPDYRTEWDARYEWTFSLGEATGRPVQPE
jgi:hypothetical protein